MLYVETTEFNILIDNVKSNMNDTFIWISIFEIIIASSILIISIIIAFFFINKLIRPIVLLTNYAQAINQTAHSENKKKVKNLVKCDINTLQVIIFYLKIKIL